MITDETSRTSFIAQPDDPILITGATGFIGSRVVERLLDRGFRNLRCLARPSSDVSKLQALASRYDGRARVDITTGNLLSRPDCVNMTRDVAVVIYLAAARGEKSVPDAFMNSVVTTRNLLDATLEHACLNDRQHQLVRGLTNARQPGRSVLDESSPVEQHPARRGDAYSFAKVKQDEIVIEYGAQYAVPYVLVRPGYVYGPGNEAITGRVGIGTFGVFLHLGGGNTIPFTFVDNCAEAIVLAGLVKGVDGQVFNVVDDDLPSSRSFLRQYKRNVRRFTSVYLPHAVSYTLCYLWESYSNWSHGQLPPTFNRLAWRAFWRQTRTRRQVEMLLDGVPRSRPPTEWRATSRVAAEGATCLRSLSSAARRDRTRRGFSDRGREIVRARTGSR
jgi:nucleoside-diphosphate-sugar epimerase